jgi:hypothetical protein
MPDFTFNNNTNDIASSIIEVSNETKVSDINSTRANPGNFVMSQDNLETILVISSQPDPPETKRLASDYTYTVDIEADAISVEPDTGGKITTWGTIKSR